MTARNILTKTIAAALLGCSSIAYGAPEITRLTPPSALFTFNDPTPPYIARFLEGQRFDLQCTIKPDAGQTITSVSFSVDGKALPQPVALAPATVPAAIGSTVATLRAFSASTSGVQTFTATARQSDGQTITATGNFEVIGIKNPRKGGATNIIVMIGDGLGASHRTAARIVSRGVELGKASGLLAMDTFPVTGQIMTASLNSIITDSSPGAACYATGNKSNNNQQGVFPDDTLDKFDNPRVELIGEMLARLQGRSLGIVTTSDVFDATPGSFGTHSQDRGAGTGICDQYLDETVANGGLTVLLGGGRKWFLPQGTPGSARNNSNDYVLPQELASGWSVAPGALDPQRDLISDFKAAGFTYAADGSALQAVNDSTTKLLGLFALSNMNVALDKINGRRGNSSVVNDYGFPNQPMLDEMTDKALQVLSKNKNGFVLMVEGASIDKQAHNMDSERWILDTIEFDRAVARAKAFAESRGDTLVIVTADHECGGAVIIGASQVTDASLQNRAAAGGGVTALRNQVVGTYESAGFPLYTSAPDGYPTTMDVDRKMLIGYGGNADRYEDWRTSDRPAHDAQQPFDSFAPLSTYPRINAQDANGMNATRPIRDQQGNFLITGQVPGSTAVHTGGDIPLSALGYGAIEFTGTYDNTDVFFRAMSLAFDGKHKK
jgi:alkaline phosphatase